MHHLDCTSCEPECHWPHGGLSRPIGETVELRHDVLGRLHGGDGAELVDLEGGHFGLGWGACRKWGVDAGHSGRRRQARVHPQRWKPRRDAAARRWEQHAGRRFSRVHNPVVNREVRVIGGSGQICWTDAHGVPSRQRTASVAAQLHPRATEKPWKNW